MESRVYSGEHWPLCWCLVLLTAACAQGGDSTDTGRDAGVIRPDAQIFFLDGSSPRSDSGALRSDASAGFDAGRPDGGTVPVDAGRPDGGGATCTCMAGATGAESEGCACGGTRTRTRMCQADCTWGAWGAFGACAGGMSGACTPGMTRGCANGDPCGVETCGATCTWGACMPSAPGGCLRIRPGTMGPAGNNYRCCTSPPPPGDANGMGWQFCLPTCAWSADCEATTAC